MAPKPSPIDGGFNPVGGGGGPSPTGDYGVAAGGSGGGGVGGFFGNTDPIGTGAQDAWDWAGGRLNQFGHWLTTDVPRWLGDRWEEATTHPGDKEILARLRGMSEYSPDVGAFQPSGDMLQARRYAQGLMSDPNQARLIQQLQAQAEGRGPSLAQMQADRAAQQNMAQAMGMLSGQRGLGGLAGMRQVAGQRASIGQDLAGQSAMARLQEQMLARQQLGAQIGQNRQQQLMAADLYNRAAAGDRDAMMQLEQLRAQQRIAWNAGVVDQYRGMLGNPNPTTMDRILGAVGTAADLALTSQGVPTGGAIGSSLGGKKK